MKKLLILIPAIIITIAISASLAAPHVQRAIYPLKYSTHINNYSKELDLDPYLISAIIYEESRFKKDSRSGAGALGLMQIMPETARWISNQSKMELEDGSLLVPKENIALGTWYFNWLLDKYDNETRALAAYNGGENNIDAWLKRNGEISDEEFIKNIPFKETRAYVERVKISRSKYQDLYPEEF